MRTTRLVAASALGALLLLPMGAAARAPRMDASVSPAAGFTATITTKAYTKSLTTAVKVGATSVPSGKSVTGYYLSENPTANPTGATSGWKVAPSTFALSAVDGTHTIYVWARTKTQVSARAQVNTFLDRTAPTVSSFDVTPLTSTVRSVAVTFTSSDAGGAAASGITKYAVVNGTAVPDSTSTAWKLAAPTSVSLKGANGVKTVSAFVKDAAGNVSPVASDTVTLNMPAPSVDLQLPAYTKSQSVAVDLTFTDGAGAGLAGYVLKETNSTPAASATWVQTPTTFKLSATNGSKTVYAWVKDKAGNISAVDSATTYWDNVAPTASLTISTASPTTDRDILVTGSGNALSGSPIAKYAAVDGTTAPTLQSDWKDTMPTGLTLKVGNGVHNVSLFVKDAAGNVSAASTKQITLTPPKPTVSFKVNQKTVVGTTSVPISISTTDPSGTGIKGYFLSATDVSGTLTAATSGWKLVTTTFTVSTGDGLKTIYIWVKDGNNTVSNAASVQVRLDTTVPVATVTVTGNSTSSPVVTVAGTDTGGSGIKSYSLTLSSTAPDKDDSLYWFANATDASNALSLATATQTVYGWVQDNAGNVSALVVNTSSKSVTKN